LGQDRPAVEGSWQGAIFYVPAEQELEESIELFQDARGVLAGVVNVPVKPIENEPLSAVRFDGKQISWELKRESGTFPYVGTLSADGNEISGQLTDRGKTYPFTFHRRDPAVADAANTAPVHPPLHPLAASGAELKAAFNGDAGKVRLVLLLSPG
jgi:hypothetical protein